MRIIRMIVAAAVIAGVAGCGSTAHHAAANRARLTWSERPGAQATVLMVRRIRYEGATLRTMYVHRDGSVDVDVPNGGAGGSKYVGRIPPRTFTAMRRQIASIPWGHLSRRKRFLDASGGYWIVRHGRSEHVAMSNAVSVDLLPLLRTMDGVFDGGLRGRRTLHRFGRL